MTIKDRMKRMSRIFASKENGLDGAAEEPVAATEAAADDAARAATEEAAHVATEEAVPAAKEKVAKAAAADASEATATEQLAGEMAAGKKTPAKEKKLDLVKKILTRFKKHSTATSKHDSKPKADEPAASGEAAKTHAAAAAEEPSTTEPELVDAPAHPEDTTPAAEAAPGAAK
ncbi:hypothetical protein METBISCDRAFT_24098 [Metschnikowia bicuspidata]|uniref:Uncharacterized protein n=1 Tax=Metschnikowia bicuspidata TaxID=27322 RepID=A0A4P9Z9X6_9ASCO|nr:hypothetical protein METBISCDRAFT_24098 [Metschnikowia bicuspidata]